MSEDLPEIGHTVTTLGIVEKALGRPVSDGYDHIVFENRARLLELIDDLATAREMEASNDIGGMTYEEYRQKWTFLKSPAELEELRTECERSDARATAIYNALLHEIELLKAGEHSELMMLDCPSAYEGATFTKRSAYTWLQKMFGIEIDDWAPPEKPEDADGGMLSKNEREKYDITLAVLTKLYADARGNTCGDFDKPTVKNIAEEVAEKIDELRATRPGLSAKTTATRLSHSLDFLRQAMQD